MPEFYIPRRIRLGTETLTEEELLRQPGPIVVLAEPGAGKTELLEHLASLLGTQRVRANRFRNPLYTPSAGALVIDAMDEVAKIDEGALNNIVEKASVYAAGAVIFSSRSGEWEKARTRYVEDCFGAEPTIVHLDAFDPAEQRALFDHVFPGESFDHFVQEARRCDLHPLLSNPEFLQLLGHGYIGNNRRFESKRQAYADAARKLAQENSLDRGMRGRPEADVLVNQAGSVFARLLLSGASGVSRVEKVGDRDFPYANIVDGEVEGGLDHLLNSKLFKPTDDANEHEPVHRIMAEYLGANYLTARIADAGSGLSLKRCLAIVAPNGVVRDELRGMLGWMAALGSDNVQRAAIELDPYAVLSNGDPAQLSTANKVQLIRNLQAVSKSDPYFRRGDYWRSFNVGNFFNTEVVDALRPILTSGIQVNLRSLLLDLLVGTNAVTGLVEELEGIVVDPTADSYSRISSMRLLLQEATYDLGSHFELLLTEGSTTSLHVLAEYTESKTADAIGHSRLIALLRGFIALFTDQRERRRRGGDDGGRYFIKTFLRELQYSDIPSLLDELTANITCGCDPGHDYRCECRKGVSKVVGDLLDRYFSETHSGHDASRIWGWIKELRFERHMSSEDSTSVKALRSQDELRRAIQKIAFEGADTDETAAKIDRFFYLDRTHSGLRFDAEDVAIAINEAFASDNVILWNELWRSHSPYREYQGPDAQRSTMRKQAREKPAFLRAWTSRDQRAQAHWRKNRESWQGRRRRRERLEAAQEAAQMASLAKHRATIEAGQHWGWLEPIAHRYLYKPDELSNLVGDLSIAHNAIRNCLPFLEPYIPDLGALAKNEWTNVARVLHAHCLLHFRENGTLDGIDERILKVVKTEASRVSGMGEGEAERFEAELDRLLFKSPADTEAFVRQYIEPNLSGDSEAVTRVEWLNYKKSFHSLRPTLAMEWLRSYPLMPYQAETELFRIAATHAPRGELIAIIEQRLAEHATALPADAAQNAVNRRLFWLLNAFFFLGGDGNGAWQLLQCDKEILFSLIGRLDRFGGDEDDASPLLSPEKAYMVLDAYVEIWPPVHLPSGWGTHSPKEERAYRFLSGLPGMIGRGSPNEALPVLDRLIADDRFARYRPDLIGVRATVARKHALQHFQPPTPTEISSLLERQHIASVEDMRAAVIDMLEEVEAQIRTADTDTLATFYHGGVRVDENTARDRIVDNLRSHLRANNLSEAVEFQMANNNRCDITATAMLGHRRRLLTIEVKGQWHSELFTAAAEQLSTRYSSNVDAEQQGIYLVLWFGPDEAVAGLKNTKYKTPEELRNAILSEMPVELQRRISVQMFDLSEPPAKAIAKQKKAQAKVAEI